MKIDLVALIKRAGVYRRDKFVARAITPTTAQRNRLLRVYMQVVREWQRQFAARVLPEYERTLDGAGFRDSVASTSGEVDEATNALNRLVVALGADLSGFIVEIEQWHRGQFGQLFTPTGVRLNMLLGPGDVGPTLQAALGENVALIRSLNDQMRNGISGAVFRGLQNRTPSREVAREVRRLAGIGQRRAELIAADQLQKLTSRLDQSRQEQLGIVSFEWAHSGKQNPRQEHVERDGKVYRWDSPVGKNDPPGRAIRCGCRSRAVVDIDEAEATAAPPAPPVPPPPAPAPVPRPPAAVVRPGRVVRRLTPPPEPVQQVPNPAPGGFRSPRNPNLTNETLRVEKRLALQKQLTAQLAAAAADERYKAVGRYKGRSDRDYGRAAFSAEWSDEAVSAVVAIVPELDDLAAQIGIARLRGYKTTAGSQNADMGGGVMALSPTEFNARIAAGRKPGGASELAEAARDQNVALLEQQREIAAQIDDLAQQRTAAIRADDFVLSERLRGERNELVKRYESLRRKRQKLLGSAQRAERAQDAEKTTWKPGDDPAGRPWSVALYYEPGIDRIRSTMYHEFAHHVHQTLKISGPWNRPLEIRLRELWAQNRADPAFRNRQASSYALHNQHEWFAENFSLFAMGRRELVDPILVELIEDIFNGRF